MKLSDGGKGFLVIVLVLIIFPSATKAEQATASAPTPTVHHGVPELQKKRSAFIEQAIQVGIISRIDDKSPVTRVWTGQKYSALPFDEKQQILNVIWAYYITKDPRKNIVRVIDRKSGKEIGEYSPANGGLKIRD